jgi:hypothetical protein
MKHKQDLENERNGKDAAEKERKHKEYLEYMKKSFRGEVDGHDIETIV